MVLGMIAYQLGREEPANAHLNLRSKISVKRGDEILVGPYPKAFSDFVGQEKARLQIIAAVQSAVHRHSRMDHMLLASGYPGIGKTALSRLTAHLRGVGFVELGGTVTDRDAAKAIDQMEDGDILFLDEIHRLVAGGKARAEWLLTLLQDGALHTPQGVIQAPDITVIAATTDAQRLPETILDRFVVKPILEPYSSSEAVEIGHVIARRLGFGDTMVMPESDVWLQGVAKACDNNPRRMTQLLSIVRDVVLSESLTPGADGYDLSIALDWSGLTPDGLTSGMQDYLVALHVYGGKAGISTLKAATNETDLTHTEKALIQRGYVVVATGGRELTEFGAARAEGLARDQHAALKTREEA